MDNAIEQLRIYAENQGIDRRELARRLGIPHNTVRGWLGSTSKRVISRRHLSAIEEFLKGPSGIAPAKSTQAIQPIAAVPKVPYQPKPVPSPDASRRADKVRMLLLLLEDELRWFRNHDATARSEYRDKLDPYDIGYISSLLSMMTD